MKKDRESIMASLAANTPKEILPLEIIPEYVGPTNVDIIKDTETDYDFARSHIKKLIDVSDEAIATMHNLATDAEHPRAFEVLSGMIKNASDMNNNLMILLRDRKKLVIAQDKGGVQPTQVGNTTNNAIFVGSTIELQKFLKDQQPAVDV